MHTLGAYDDSIALLIGAILGVLSHQLVFIHGEWHLSAPTVVYVHILGACLIIGLNAWTGSRILNGHFNAIAAITSYLASLFTSISVYRLFFHRMRHFPGPKLAALSKLWHVWQCRDSRNHLVLEALFQEFGSFVRTGEILLHTIRLSIQS